MTCSICSAPATGDLCEACQARRVIVRPASRFLVDRAARRTARLVAMAEPEHVAALDESLDLVRKVGRQW